MSPNLHAYDRLVRFFLFAFALFAAVALFEHPLARILAAAFSLFALWEGVVAKCPLMFHLGKRSPKESVKHESTYLLGLVGIQVVLAYQWIIAGWEKISNPDFVSGMSQTISYFSSKNPFAWYVSFLRDVVMENAMSFAYLVEWSQICIAIALFVSGVMILYTKDSNLQRAFCNISIIALLGGAIMNANFYFAAGWTSPGAHGINVLMFWAQLLLAYVWLMTSQKRA